MTQPTSQRPDDPQRVLEQQQKRAERDAKAEQPSRDPQLRRVHDSAQSPDEAGRGNETSMNDGGARHRQQ